MKKIAIFMRDITERGGGERVGIGLANAFCDSYEVLLFSLYKSQAAPSYAIDPRVKVMYLSQSSDKCKNKLKAFFNKHILRLILNLDARKFYQDCDVIFANDRALLQGLKMPNKRYVRLWHLKFAKKNLRFFDDLVLPSGFELAKWQKIHPKVSVIPNFLPSLPREVADHSQKVILAVGRFCAIKDFLGLIENYAKIARKYPQWKLRIVGGGELEERMQERIQALNMREFIELHPFMQEISKAYLGASIFVLSSVSEGFSNVLIESASYGLSAVSFDVPAGPSEIIIDQKTGFLIPHRSYDQLLQRLEILMNDEAMRLRMGLEAKRYVSQKFSQPHILKKWQDLFGESHKSTQ